MRSLPHPVLPVAALVCALLGVWGCGPSLDGQAVPVREKPVERVDVAFASGRVDVFRERFGWLPLRSGGVLSVEDSVRTGEDGRLEMVAEGRKIRVERGSTLTLVGADRGARVDVTGIRLARGRVWAQVRGGRDLEIASGRVIASSGQGTLSAATLPGDRTRVAAYEGIVAASYEGIRRPIPANTGLEIRAGRASAHPVESDDDWRDGWLSRRAASVPPPLHDSGPTRLQQTRDLKDLNPDVYFGVELEVAGARMADSLAVDSARIRRIRVRAHAWDALAAHRKVDLLNQTFAVLKARYPDIQTGVVLNFDDARPDLPLRYPGDL